MMDKENLFPPGIREASKRNYLRGLREKEAALSKSAYYAWFYLPSEQLDKCLAYKVRPMPKLERNIRITKAVLEGCSLVSMARWFGLSRQTVKEILLSVCRRVNRSLYVSVVNSCFSYHDGEYIDMPIMVYRDPSVNALRAESESFIPLLF